jgi:hypothetical protein
LTEVSHVFRIFELSLDLLVSNGSDNKAPVQRQTLVVCKQLSTLNIEQHLRGRKKASSYIATDPMAPVLRRRGQLSPLNDRDLSEETEYQPSGRGNVFEHYISPCEFRVSNDPLISESDVCDATRYGCVRDHEFMPDTKEQVKELNVEFDYDMYYRNDSRDFDFYEMLEFLEGVMLEHLASLVELEQCQGDTLEGSTRRKTRRFLQESFSEDQIKSIVSLSSEPGDVKASGQGEYSSLFCRYKIFRTTKLAVYTHNCRGSPI